MAGAAKKRVARERHEKAESSNDKTSSSGDQTSGSPVQFQSPPRFDGNRDPTEPRERAMSAAPSGQVVAYRNRNLDLGAGAAFLLDGHPVPSELPLRGNYNKSGKEINVRLNTFHVISFPDKPVYQYDITIGSGTEKRGLISRVWRAKAFQAALGPGWLFDGNKLAWSMRPNVGDGRYTVDLDADSGKQPRIDKKTGQAKPDVHRVAMKRTKQLDFASLRTYLAHKADFNNACLEAINFMDHLMRETPSQQYTSIKRSFFARGEDRTLLGQGVEAFKGVYASIRMINLGGPTGKESTGGLSVNVDVANTTFWTESRLQITAMQIVNARDGNHLGQLLAAGKDYDVTPAFIALRKLKKLAVWTPHRPETKDSPYIIDRMINKTPKQHMFNTRDPKTGVEKSISVEQYFRETYKIILEFPQLPVVQMTKASIVVPMELCMVAKNQRYPFKLSDKQTMEMIKFAVTLPGERWRSIQAGVDMLKWEEDKYLKAYEMKINPQPAAIKARLLPNPKVGFGGNKTEDPRQLGRWDLRGKVFAGPHPKPLQAWGVSVTPGRFAVSKEQVQAFLTTFITVFAGHGGKIANKTPLIMQGSDNASKDVEALYNSIGNANKMIPQLMVFIVPDKDSGRYLRIKKSCDCRYGIVSQVLQSAHVQKNQAQYCSNVCMKVNAKLGGWTSKALGMTKPFPRPTMIIGADVSHASPGTDGASIASFTVSFDQSAIKYCAAVQTNGSRVEMIAKANTISMLEPMLRRWASEVGKGQLPHHILYFRDGVSEGQYHKVLQDEVADIREVLLIINPKQETRFTVLVASKRHHVRFFPDKAGGDRNGNPQPGTLVETAVTHPFEYDFYLCAHSAIKGTARPVHYYVLRDDAKMGVEELQNMIYEHSYQFVRSTTPVSMFPAVYYAHLAAARGLAHVRMPETAPPKEKGKEKEKTESTPKPATEIPTLLPMIPNHKIDQTMWYV